MRVRLNDYHDLPMLQALYEGAGHNPDQGWAWTGDWSGWWAVAEDHLGRAVGCLQLGMSRPQATLETLCVPQAFSKLSRARIVRQLVYFALQMFRHLEGVQSVRFQADGSWDSRIFLRRSSYYLHSHPTYIRGL